MFIFTIYDTVAERAGNLFMTFTMSEAERQFKDAILSAQQGSLFNSHPESFQLWLVGEFDEHKPLVFDTRTTMVMEGKTVISDKVLPSIPTEV